MYILVSVEVSCDENIYFIDVKTILWRIKFKEIVHVFLVFSFIYRGQERSRAQV